MANECPKCQTENTSDSHFCKRCSTPLKPPKDISVCFGSEEFGQFVIFSKLRFSYNKTEQGDINEHQKEAITRIDCSGDQEQDPPQIHCRGEDPNHSGRSQGGREHWRPLQEGGDPSHHVLKMEQGLS